jgi:hypothetical protein
VEKTTKLQWLQYRINQRILGTNKFLYKIEVKDNAFCTFCQEDEETIELLFWNCKIVQAFIDEIDSWLLSNGVSIPFNYRNLFVPRIRWLILYCNHCNLVFCVTIKGSLNISLHFVSSKPEAKISSHLF